MKTRTYPIKYIPEWFKKYLEENYPAKSGFKHSDYYYYKYKDATYYSAVVTWNGVFDSIPQISEQDACTHEIMDKNYTCAGCGFQAIIIDEQ